MGHLAAVAERVPGMTRNPKCSSRAGGLLTRPTHTRRGACRQTLWLGNVCRLSRPASCGKTGVDRLKLWG